jgi:hypothetical protein
MTEGSAVIPQSFAMVVRHPIDSFPTSSSAVDGGADSCSADCKPQFDLAFYTPK